MYNRFFSRTLTYVLICLLCTSHATQSMFSQQKKDVNQPLLVHQKANNFWCKHKKSIALGTAFVATAGMSLLMLGMGINSLKEYNEDCSHFDIGSSEVECNTTSIDSDMSSDQEYACYCNSLEQQSFLSIAGGGGMLMMSIAFPASMWIYEQFKKSDEKIPTASSLIEMHKHNGEDNV